MTKDKRNAYMREWNAQRMDAISPRQELCHLCGSLILGRRRDARFCSKSCYQRDYHARHRDERREEMAAYRERNRATLAAKQRVYAAKNKARTAAYMRKRAFGISQEQFDEMVLRQNGLCAICLHAPTKRALHVDHDHKTGRIRGLLCGSCNLGLGKFYDRPELLERATVYLREASA